MPPSPTNRLTPATKNSDAADATTPSTATSEPSRSERGRSACARASSPSELPARYTPAPTECTVPSASRGTTPTTTTPSAATSSSAVARRPAPRGSARRSSSAPVAISTPCSTNEAFISPAAGEYEAPRALMTSSDRE